MSPASVNICAPATPTGQALRMLFIFHTVGTRWLDKQFPHQNRESVLVENQIMETWVRRENNVGRGVRAEVMSLWNLTKNAQSYDGNHHLSEVNVVVANAWLRYLERVAQEEGH